MVVESKGSSEPNGCHACRLNVSHPFHCLPPLALEAVQHVCIPRLYRVDEILFEEGTYPHAVYCISTGSVRLTREGPRGTDVLLGTRHAGDQVGFRAVIASMTYGATATTQEASRICSIPCRTFLELVRQNPNLTFELLRRMARRYRLSEEQLVGRAVDSVRVRVARLLLSVVANPGGEDRYHAAPDIERGEMALLIGTTRETLSRTLHELERKGILSISASKVKILEPAKLRAILDAS